MEFDTRAQILNVLYGICVLKEHSRDTLKNGFLKVEFRHLCPLGGRKKDLPWSPSNHTTDATPPCFIVTACLGRICVFFLNEFTLATVNLCSSLKVNVSFWL